ncbi:hypothetical protein BDF19DRAFT_499577 [Syncephalis fuscata]|nr:hypothetical protein BDF19DRAFT_499577 [Syncephalis fuscata]
MTTKNITLLSIVAAICLAGLTDGLQVATTNPISTTNTPKSGAITNDDVADPFTSVQFNTPNVFGNSELQITKRLPVDEFGIPGAEAVYNGVKGEIRCVPTGMKTVPNRYIVAKRVGNYQNVKNGKPVDPSIRVRNIDLNGLKFISGLLLTTDTPKKSHQCFVTKNTCVHKLMDYTNRLSIEEKANKLGPLFGQVVQGINFMRNAGLLYKNFGPDYICLNTDKYGKLEASICQRNYNPKATLPDNFFKSPELVSLRTEMSKAKSLAKDSSQQVIYNSAKRNYDAMVANARTLLRPLIAVMNTMLNPNIGQRPSTEEVAKNYRATLSIFNPVPTMPSNSKL